MDADCAAPYESRVDFRESPKDSMLATVEGAMVVFGRGGRTEGLLATESERLKALAGDIERILQGVPPEAIAGDETAPILDRWFLANRAAPCLVGLSTGHPKLTGENRSIATSDVWLISHDMAWARTLSRWYRLGRPVERSGLDA
ncbi:DUF6634 family protein [Mesorhizobium sp.]|uniref:DUF6634 family protein n=1 Tax=Mesorhizobium sp. TaxID=1871066 RepID=UPI003457D8C7